MKASEQINNGANIPAPEMTKAMQSDDTKTAYGIKTVAAIAVESDNGITIAIMIGRYTRTRNSFYVNGRSRNRKLVYQPLESVEIIPMILNTISTSAVGRYQPAIRSVPCYSYIHTRSHSTCDENRQCPTRKNPTRENPKKIRGTTMHRTSNEQVASLVEAITKFLENDYEPDVAALDGLPLDGLRTWYRIPDHR
ncbi:hypothetical protein EVAR_56513_1 [Eumeta japonica]|uniref:Uncharacterized protein n=1 Tax=Eumeta variegata TaxID=151549 RepID=A0A4C1ZBC2_EUMVA|nr:hypothetical protein EVAR_56513_1 [Eumeta japonica]